MTEIVRLQKIFKWVGEGENRTSILNGVDLSLHAGEYVAMMGASGSGKSTLLNIIGLLDTPSAGCVWMEGQDISAMAEDQLAALRARSIGFIFQSFNLLSYLTALENVKLPMQYSDVTPADRKRGSSGVSKAAGSRLTIRRDDGRAEELLKRVGLDHHFNAYPATLSGGERQRVAIARSLANRPSLILADEPTGALDSKTGAQVMDLLSQLHREGTTVVLVTHDEKIARRAQRILKMKDGRFE